jgi:hypothetical protein
MTAPLPQDTPLQLQIGRIRISAASGLDARRLSDALPAALQRALAGSAPTARRASPADEAASAIVKQIMARVEAGQ